MLRSLSGAYGRWLVEGKHAWMVVLVVALLSGGAALLAQQVETEDDLLAFLPKDNADIEEFRNINTDFGGLDVALIGIETEDVFEPSFLTSLQVLSQRIGELEDVSYVLSLTTVTDLVPSEDGGVGSERSALIGEIPEDDAQREALRARVMARDLVVGQLVSEDQSSVLIYAFAAPGAEPRGLVRQLRALTDTLVPEQTVHMGGAAPVSTYIYDTTQADMQRLTPWAVGAIVVLMLLAFRDVRGTLLALVGTGLGILFSHAAMSVAGVSLNVVLSSMPIILFAVGSAYGIHILARYQCHASAMDSPAALIHTLEQTGPTVLISGLTTALGLLSFMAMDIGPLQTFGLFTSIGILSTLALSLCFIPAVILVARIPGRETMQGAGARLGIRCVVGIQRHRRRAGGVMAGVLAVGAFFVSRVDSRVDQSAFYAEDSPPALADSFMADRFGGSQFIQVRLRAELREPEIMRELQRVADTIRRVPGVTRVSHLGDAMAVGNGVTDGWARIPDTREDMSALLFLLAGEPALRQLVTDEQAQALIQVQIQASGPDQVEAVLDGVESVISVEAMKGLDVVSLEVDPTSRVRLQDRVARRLLAIGLEAGLSSELEVATVADGLGQLNTAVNPAIYSASIERLLLDPEVEMWVGSLVSPERARETARRVAERSDWDDDPSALFEAVAAVEIEGEESFDEDTLGVYLHSNLEGPLQDARAGVPQSVAELLEIEIPVTDRGERVASRWIHALRDLDVASTVGVPGSSKALDWTVSGQPVMHRGLSESVQRNQWLSMLSAMALVAILLGWTFRSVTAGLLATTPIAAALIGIYGGMGWAGIRLDIGTSMLASLVIGAGVDYAVHFLSSWRAREGEPLDWAAGRAAARTGPAIWTNALMVASGFFVLTLGEARPLENVGGLTASAMLFAALATFLLIPVLAGRRRYTRTEEGGDPADRLLIKVLGPGAPEVDRSG